MAAGLVVTFTFLMLTTGAAAADAMTGLVRGLRAGYPRDILLDAALDRRRDGGDLVNGLGPFALVPESRRREMIVGRRVGAAVLLVGMTLTGAILGSWPWGIIPHDWRGLVIAAIPFLGTIALRGLLTFPERRVRIRASREAGARWFSTTPPIRGELVAGWLEDAGRPTPRPATAKDRWRLEALTLPWLVLLGPLVALVMTLFAGWGWGR
ncbi:MAG TPA: hypothetical protein VFI13_04230 [Gemmatimonadales bacterium]|nr:hypothetical protein [Gemmatimonadales bacterium]